MIEKIVDFDCEGKTIAVVSYEGKVWFVGAQISGALGYGQIATTIRNHCPDRKLVPTSELRKAGVSVKGPSTTYIVSPLSALQLVMKSVMPNGDTVRNLFMFVAMPYLYANHAHEIGADAVDRTNLKIIYSQLASVLFEKGEADTRIIAVHETERKW